RPPTPTLFPYTTLFRSDDDPALRTLLRTTFEIADVEVVEAESAQAARRKIHAARPDVIVLDVNMPGTTGLEFCEELKRAPATQEDRKSTRLNSSHLVIS